MSSESCIAIYFPFASFIPSFRVSDMPLFCLWFINFILLSFSAYSFIISRVLSALASLIIINSKLLKVCFKTDSIASAIYFSEL